MRDFDPARDREAALSFIEGLQRHEHVFEPDRRLDAHVAQEFLPTVLARVADSGGRIFIAEDKGIAVGWAVFVVERNMLYVVEEVRTHGYIAELFLVEEQRGLGHGRALIMACEEEARRLGLKQMMIGVLAGNRRTAGLYSRAGYEPYSTEMRKYL